MPPVQPMLAKPAKAIPGPEKFAGGDPPGVQYEPKWDGFRCLVFRDGDEIELTSRNTKPLTRYFPDVVEALRASVPPRCVLDGELVVAIGDATGVRPAAGPDPPGGLPGAHAGRDPAGVVRRVRPARPGRRGPLRASRLHPQTALLEEAHGDGTRARPPDPGHARSRRGRRWFEQFEGAGLDGVMVKPLAGPLRAQRPHDGQGQARPHRRLRRGRLPPAQDLDPGAAAARLSPARPLRRPAATSTTSASAPASRPPGGPSSSTELAALVASIDDHPWAEWQQRIQQPTGSPAARAAGAVGRTSRSSRCAPSGSSRSATTTWRATGSGTPPSSSGGAPTGTPTTCGYDQLEEPVSYDLRRILGTLTGTRLEETDTRRRST